MTSPSSRLPEKPAQMDPPRTTLCPGYKHVTAFSPALSSPKSKSTSVPLPPSTTTTNDQDQNENNEEEESEYEEEIEYVTLDLGNIEPTLVPSSSTYRLIGLDTPTPYLQLSGTILRGRHESLLGSELIFTDKDSTVAPATTAAATTATGTATGQKKKSVTHVSTTSKRISFREVRLRPKEKKGGIEVHQYVPAEVEEGEDEGGLEYADVGGNVDTNMDVDGGLDVDEDLEDALEYVDLGQMDVNSEASISAPPFPSEPGPTGIPTIAATPGPPIGPSIPASVPVSTSTITAGLTQPNLNRKGKGKEAAQGSETPMEAAEEPSDPAMCIDRLTGISPPLTRAPRGATGAKKKTTATSKGKQKEMGDSDIMDTTEG